MTKVVNLFAGPGSGKSTGACAVFAICKMHDVNCEYVAEYAKDESWQKTIQVYYNPIKYLGEQHDRQFRLKDQVDFMMTDSPLLQQCVYVEDQFYEEMCVNMFDEFDNLNFFIERSKLFNEKGRKHNLVEAKVIDNKIKTILNHYDYKFETVQGDYNGYNYIAGRILDILGVEKKIQLGKQS